MFQHRDVYRYDPARGRFRDWLGTVVRNKVAEHRRRPANRLRAAGGDSDQLRVELAADEQGPDAAWEAAFESSLLLALLDAVRRESQRPRLPGLRAGRRCKACPAARRARLTGLSRNAVYKANKRVLQRLIELGAPYRDEGRLARADQAGPRRAPARRRRTFA